MVGIGAQLARKRDYDILDKSSAWELSAVAL